MKRSWLKLKGADKFLSNFQQWMEWKMLQLFIYVTVIWGNNVYKKLFNPNLENVNGIFQFIFFVIVDVKVPIFLIEVTELKEAAWVSAKEKSNKHHNKRKRWSDVRARGDEGNITKGRQEEGKFWKVLLRKVIKRRKIIACFRSINIGFCK